MAFLKKVLQEKVKLEFLSADNDEFNNYASSNKRSQECHVIVGSISDCSPKQSQLFLCLAWVAGSFMYLIAQLPNYAAFRVMPNRRNIEMR